MDSKRDNTNPSCTVCQRRKVRCSRELPCASCIKSGLDCSYASPSRKRPRISKEFATSLEESPMSSVPDSSAIPSTIDPFQSASILTPQSSSSSQAHLVSDGQGVRYVNNYIWNALPKQPSNHEGSHNTNTLNALNTAVNAQATEIGEQPHGDSNLTDTEGTAIGSSSQQSFVFSSSHAGEGPVQLQPQHIVTLWQKYIQNVDPVMKVVHVPTTQHLVLGQVGKSSLSANDQSLVSSIFFISAVSLKASECSDLLQSGRDRMIRKLRNTTERALPVASFITTAELAVVQALVLYLAALRTLGEHQAVWSMLGMAIRIAGSLGMARDGSTLGLTPFECEMRRRVWWALVYLDGRTAELVGQDGDLLVQQFDVQIPCNVCDSELFVSMKKAPPARSEASEAIYVVQRARYGSVLHSSPPLAALTRASPLPQPSNIQQVQPFDEIRDLQSRITNEFTQYCDPTVPLQLFTTISARTFINKLLLVAQLPPGKSDTANTEAFALSLEAMELQLSLWSEPSLQQWQWYWIGHFHWFAFISLIRQTRLCQGEAMAKRGWAVIRKVLDIVIPTIDIGVEKSLLLETIRSLLESAKSTQRQSEQGHVALPDASSKGSNTFTNAKASPGRFFYQRGTRPHNAILPGMSTTSFETKTTAKTTSDDDQDFPLELDLDTIDWAEFDRLASGLYDQ